MQTTFYICAAIALLVVIVHFGLKVLDWIKANKKFYSSKSEFLSDLYKLQHKWNKKGEYEYAKACSLVIESFNLVPEIPEAKTPYGKEIQKILEKLKQEEENEEINEQ